MKMPRRALMAGSVFALALATGYVMQNGDALASRFAGQQAPVLAANTVGPMPVTAPQPVLVPASVIGMADGGADQPLPMDPDAPKEFAARTSDFATRMAGLESDPAALAREPERRFSEYGLPCAVEFSAREELSGMVLLMLDAPCYAASPVTVRHGDLKFTEITNDAGRLQVSVPALHTPAEYMVSFDDGSDASAKIDVEAANRFHRVALQSMGDTTLGIHALELGAAYGEAGHVHAAMAYGPERALHQDRGFMTVLGNANVPGAWLAQVYSFPKADSRRDGAVRISIETEITAANCGREMRAETLQPGVDGHEPVELVLSVPGCEARGDILVLKNVLRDMKIAAN